MGKPVFNRVSNASFGSWMKDPMSRDSNDTIWMTVNEINALYQFSNKSMFKDNRPTKTYTLSYSFHVSKMNKTILLLITMYNFIIILFINE